EVMAKLREENGARANLLDLAILSADLGVRLAPTSQLPSAHGSALRLLDEAEELLGGGAVLYRERQRHALALGLFDVAGGGAGRAGRSRPRTAWDHYALARLLLQTPPPFTCGGPTGSSAVSTLAGLNEVTAGLLLQRACALDPGGFWPHFVFGQHAYRLGHYHEAIAAFGVSVGVAPRQP